MRRRHLLLITTVSLAAALLGACAQPLTRPDTTTAQRVPAEQATLDQFLAIRAARNGQLAPDGTFYFMDRPEAAYQLFVRRGDEPPRALTDFPDGIMTYDLSPDGRYIVVVAGRGGDEQGDLYLLTTATGRIEPLFESREISYGSVVWRRDSGAFAYRANDRSPRDFHVYVFDLRTRQPRSVWAHEGSNFPVDFSSDGTRLIVQRYHSSYYQQAWEVDLTSGEAREISPPDAEKRFLVVGYTGDNRSAIVATNYASDTLQLARVHTNTGRIEPILSQLAGHDVDACALSEARRWMAVVLNEDGYGVLHVHRLDDLAPVAVPAIPRGVVGNLRFAGETLLFTLNNAQDPGTTYRWDPECPQDPPVALAEPVDGGIDLTTCVLPELVRYPSFDGLEIPAFVYLPRGYTRDHPIPFIIYYHGGPEGQHRPYMNVTVQYFVSRGFGVFLPNVRGSAGYGTWFLNLDNYRNRMNSVRDGIEGIHWLIRQGYTRPGMIGAYGGSYGGFMVMASITEAPDLFGAACDIVGIVNFETFLKNTRSYRRALREAEYGPLTDPEFLRSISPIHRIDRIRCPLLVVHGRNDPRVPVGEAEQIVEALRQRNHPVEALIFDDEGHGIVKQPNRRLFYEKMTDFFIRHLKGSTT